MTARDTIAWIEEKGYYDRWILPELGVYKDFPEVKKTCNNRPIGDTLEGMPLDNNLKKHFQNDVDRQVAATRSLEDKDENKFTKSTPNRATTSYI
jgi:hypothetical protein